MKGNATIELTDVKTGKKEVIQHKNIVTNAVNDVLTLNPFYIANYDIPQWLPIVTNLYGGIRLYSETLDSNAAKYLQGKQPIAYASNDANNTEDTMRGSMNLTESGPTASGYKLVWDFATSQGNGTISSMALTSAAGGTAGFIAEEYSETFGSDSDDDTIKDPKNAVGICCIDGNTAISVLPKENHKLTIIKYKTPLKTLSLVTTGFEEILSEQDITTTTFASISSSTYFYCGFCADSDYIWGFQLDGNAETSAASAVVRWVKIKKSDFTFTEGTWTLNGCKITSPGRFNADTDPSYSSDYIYTRCLVYNGYAYFISSDKTKLYKVNTADGSCTTITLPATLTYPGYNSTSEHGSSYVHEQGGTILNEIGGIIFGKNFYLIGDTAYKKTSSEAGLTRMAIPRLNYGPFIIGYYRRLTNSSYWNNGIVHRIALCENYQATINNLNAPVTKTSSQTMKIIYTLTEA